MLPHTQSLRSAKKPAVPVPEKKAPPSQSSQMSNELFQKLKRRRGQQGEGKTLLVWLMLYIIVSSSTDMPDGKGASPDPDGLGRAADGEPNDGTVATDNLVHVCVLLLSVS